MFSGHNVIKALPVCPKCKNECKLEDGWLALGYAGGHNVEFKCKCGCVFIAHQRGNKPFVFGVKSAKTSS